MKKDLRTDTIQHYQLDHMLKWLVEYCIMQSNKIKRLIDSFLWEGMEDGKAPLKRKVELEAEGTRNWELKTA